MLRGTPEVGSLSMQSFHWRLRILPGLEPGVVSSGPPSPMSDTAIAWMLGCVFGNLSCAARSPTGGGITPAPGFFFRFEPSLVVPNSLQQRRDATDLRASRKVLRRLTACPSSRVSPHMRYKRLTDCPDGLKRLLVDQFGQDPMASPGKRSKYGNVRTEFSGEVFDSKAEASDDQDFRMQEAAGEIGGYARQVSIPLRAKGGRRMRLDFLVNRRRPHQCSSCGHVDHVYGLVLMDRKGVITPEWETKRRILEAQLGVKIEIIH